MFFKQAAKSDVRRNKATRRRVLRVELLDRREVMDGYGLQSDLLAPIPYDAKQPQVVREQSRRDYSRAPSVLVSGSVHDGAISGTGEVDQFFFQASAGQRFQLALSPNGQQFTARLRVTDPDGKIVFNNTTSNLLFPTLAAAKAGNFSIQVFAHNGFSTGSYRLGVESLSSPSNDAQTLQLGETGAGQISGTIQFDQYAVRATAGQRLQVGLRTVAGFNGRVRVYEPGGRLLVNSSTNSTLAPQFIAPSSGIYIVQVQAADMMSVGSYRVELESMTQSSAGILASGSVREQTIWRAQEVDRFVVQATAGQQFQLALAPVGFTARMRVTDPGGRIVFNNFTSQLLAPTLAAATAGNYTVQIFAHNGQATGAYRLGLESLSSPSNDAQALTLGDAVAGQISGTIQVDQYTVTAAAGQRFQVGLATVAGFNAMVRVYAPGGGRLVNAVTNSAVAPQFITPIAGTYIVQVQAANMLSQGSYRVGMESLSQPNSSVLVPGSVRNQTIWRASEVDRFIVQAAAGQRFQLALAPVGFTARMRVTDPDGRLVFNNATSQVFSPTLAASKAGNFLIEILAYDGQSTGDYRLGLESQSSPSNDAQPLRTGDVEEGQITGTIQFDQYTVNAVAGQRFQLGLATVDGFNATIRVYAPGGQLLVNNATSTAISPTFTATNAGVYVVQVHATNQTSQGSYRVGVESLTQPSLDATSLAIGSVASGFLSETVQVDQYVVTAAADQRLQIRLTTIAGLNATVRVYAPGGQMLVNNATNTAIDPQFVASSAGTYIVQVFATNLTSLGRYRVGVESVSEPSPDASPFTIGNVATGTLSETIQVDQYRVTAAAGQRFQVAMASVAGLNATLRVYAPGGGLLVNTATTSVTRSGFQAISAGTYLVQVHANNLTALGQYRVGIESLSTPSPDARMLAVGATLEGELLQVIEADQFRISTQAGQRYQIDLTPFAGMHTRIRVIEPSGGLAVNASTTTARTYSFTSNITGDLVVMIEGVNGTEIGNYSIRLRLA